LSHFADLAGSVTADRTASPIRHPMPH
jgi:hypothetical protein